MRKCRRWGFVLSILAFLLYFLHKSGLLEHIGSKLQLSVRNSHYVKINFGSFDVKSFLGSTEKLENSLENILAQHREFDKRDERCQLSSMQYLPKTSIIITFFDEARTSLLYTIASILQNTPSYLLEEIILIDDGSSDAESGSLLAKIPKVKVYRNNNPVGKIHSKLIGVKLAKGEVLTFLDAKCEVYIGWLQPLLTKINKDQKTITVPVLDVLESSTFQYIFSTGFSVGGFDWNLNQITQQSSAKEVVHSVMSPVIGGSSFSVHKSWFEKLGGYDPGMEMQGGENLELSLKTWMCGGRIEVIPCSRVGLSTSTKTANQDLQTGVNNLVRNLRRVAEVWMDDYKRFFYMHRPSARMQQFGMVSNRKNLRQQLKCQSFKWYLNTVYPKLSLPKTDDISNGQIKQGDQCIDLQPGHVPIMAVLFPCQSDKHSQEWAWKHSGEITNNGMCLTADPKETHGYVVVKFCNHDESQVWLRDKQKIQHKSSHLCLDSYKAEVGLVLVACEELIPLQRWTLPIEDKSHAVEL